MILTLTALLPFLLQTPPSPRTAGNPALRPQHQALKTLLQEGATRSPTFRDLLTALDHSTAIVYLRHGVCGSGVPACLRVQGTPKSGPILLVTVDPFDRSRDAQTALVAHELQHAREIANADTCNPAEIAKLLERLGWHGRAGFETAEAQRVTLAVQNELAAHR